MREVTGSSPVVSTKKTYPSWVRFFGNVPYSQQDLREGSVLREQNGLLAEEEYKKKMDSKLNDYKSFTGARR